MNTKEFERFVTSARPGARVVYHTGLLMADRLLDKAVDAVAREAAIAEGQGKVHLVQRRLDSGTSLYPDGECEYIAERARGDKRFDDKRRRYLKSNGVKFIRN